MSKRRQFFYYVFRLEWKKRHIVRRFGLMINRHKIIIHLYNAFKFVSTFMFIVVCILFGLYISTTPEGREFITRHDQDLYKIFENNVFAMLIFAMITAMIEFSLEIGDKYNGKTSTKKDTL